MILASSSPRRKKLMQEIFKDVRIIHPNVDESPRSHESPRDMVKRLARLKVRAVNERDIIVAADTVVEMNGEVLGKPSSEEDARKMLRKLSGNWHTVHTGVCIRKGEKEVSFVESTRVKFFHLDEETIDTYIKSGSPMDKAGAYGIQEDLGMIFVERIEGDFFTVVGLPIARLWWELKKLVS